MIVAQKSISKTHTKRLYYFDWLRMVAFVFVVLVHSIEMFHDLYQARHAASIMSDALVAFLPALAQWCMALYFLLAGASTWFALQHRTPAAFVKERLTRLLLPLLFGCVFFFPIQAYVTMLSNGTYHGSLLAFYPFFLGEILLRGHLELIVQHIHHLWFLAYLFGFSLLTLPLCLFLRDQAKRGWLQWLERCPVGLLVLALPLLCVQLTLLPAFPTYCSLADAVRWLLIYLYGYLLFANTNMQQVLRQQMRYALVCTMLCATIMLILWHAGLLHGTLPIPRYAWDSLLYQTLACLLLWSSIIVTLVVGSLYLNRTCAFLRYSCCASFYWYLLHFPIMIVGAYYILPLRLPAWCACSLIAAGTFLVTFLLTDLVPLHRQGLHQLTTILSRTTPLAEPGPYPVRTGQLKVALSHREV